MSKYAFTYQGIEFKSKNQLFKLLGYTQSMSDSMIQKQYKTLDNLVRVRLRLKHNEDIKDALLLLMKQQDQPKEQEQKPYIDDSDPAVKCARAFVTAAINKALQDNQLLSSLMLAFNIDNTDRVLHTIDEIKKGV